MKLVLGNTPKLNFLSYGRNVLFQKYYAFHTSNFISIVVSAFCILTSVIFIKLNYREINTHLSLFLQTTSLKLKYFETGILIFCGTFLLGNNWDYRLIFLFLTIPLLFEKLKSKIFLIAYFGLFYFDFIANLKISKQFGLYDYFHSIHQLVSWFISLYRYIF